jgi:hypothetical protein
MPRISAGDDIVLEGEEVRSFVARDDGAAILVRRSDEMVFLRVDDTGAEQASLDIVGTEEHTVDGSRWIDDWPHQGISDTYPGAGIFLEGYSHLAAYGDGLLAGWDADDTITLAVLDTAGAILEGPVAVTAQIGGQDDFATFVSGDAGWAGAWGRSRSNPSRTRRTLRSVEPAEFGEASIHASSGRVGASYSDHHSFAQLMLSEKRTYVSSASHRRGERRHDEFLGSAAVSVGECDVATSHRLQQQWVSRTLAGGRAVPGQRVEHAPGPLAGAAHHDLRVALGHHVVPSEMAEATEPLAF